QNASDAGKMKGKRPGQERRNSGRGQGGPQAARPQQGIKPAEQAAEKPRTASPEVKAAETAPVQNKPQNQEAQAGNRPAARFSKENREGRDSAARQGEKKGDRGPAKNARPARQGEA